MYTISQLNFNIDFLKLFSDKLRRKKNKLHVRLRGVKNCLVPWNCYFRQHLPLCLNGSGLNLLCSAWGDLEGECGRDQAFLWHMSLDSCVTIKVSSYQFWFCGKVGKVSYKEMTFHKMLITEDIYYYFKWYILTPLCKICNDSH